MFDGSPRRRKGIKCGSAMDMENNMDGTGRDMENMTMTVPNTAMTNTNMENMTMTVPNTVVTNIGMENNMDGTGMDVTGVTGVDMGSMAMAVTNAVTNMEKNSIVMANMEEKSIETAMEANGAYTETSMGTCMEMMNTKAIDTCMAMVDTKLMMDTKTMGTYMAMMDTRTMGTCMTMMDTKANGADMEMEVQGTFKANGADMEM